MVLSWIAKERERDRLFTRRQGLFRGGSITTALRLATFAEDVTNQLLPYSGVVVTDQRPRLSQIVH